MGKPLSFILGFLVWSASLLAEPTPITGTEFSLILAPESLIKPAEELKQWHTTILKIRSEVVSLETVKRATATTPDGLPFTADEAEKKKYFKQPPDEGLAAQIINYVRERAAAKNQNLTAVILFGGVTEIPPSHYLYLKRRRRWLPTDACYGGTPRCVAGKVAVGRLLLNSKQEWEGYRAKLRVWENQLSKAPGLVSLAGKGFPGPLLVGENAALGVAEAVARAGVSVEKIHRSRGNYTLKEAIRALSGETKKSYIMHFDHGEGNEIRFDAQGLSSESISEWPANNGTPSVFFSIACANAALDFENVNEKLLKLPSEKHGTIAEALLKSMAGPIGFVGSWRRAMGEPSVTVDNSGNVKVTGSVFGVDLLSRFAKSLTAGKDRTLGGAYVEAISAYLKNRAADLKEETEEYHAWTVYNFSLLGDPLLPLPALAEKVESQWQAASATKLERATTRLLPFWNGLGVSKPIALKLNVSGPSQVEIVRFYNDGRENKEETVGQRRFEKGDIDWALELKQANGDDNLMVRVENREAPFEERQIWFGLKQE